MTTGSRTLSDEVKLKPPLRLSTDEEAERFVNEANLTDYEFSQIAPVQFEFEKFARNNMRLPEPLLKAVYAKAQALGLPFQRLIRESIERAVADQQG